MCTTQQLSETATIIVKKLFIEFGGSIFTNEYSEVLKALYATMPDADESVLELAGEPFDLYEYVSESDLKVLQAERAAVVAYCVEQMQFRGRRTFGEYSIPKEVFTLCKGISDIKQGCDIFLPFAGMAQFAYNLPKCHISGYEVNPKIWALSQINLHLLGVDANISHLNSTPVFEAKENKYDLIFSCPPHLKGTEAYNVIYEFRELATKSLKEGGIMVCLLPLSFCYDSFAKGWFKVREILFDYPGLYTAAVISLPQIFTTTNARFCLFVLAKDRGDKVVLVDATDLYTTRQIADLKHNTLNVEAVFSVIKEQDERHVWAGHASDLENGLNLSPARYLLDNYAPTPKPGEQVFPLGDLIEVVQLERATSISEYPILSTKSLSEFYLSCDITRTDLPTKEGNGFRRLSQNCLVLSFMGNRFKVARVTGLSADNTVGVAPGVIPFKLKSPSLVSENYLLRSFFVESTIEQAKKLDFGVVVQNRAQNVEDLLHIKVALPSLDEQERICHKDALTGMSDAMRQKLEADKNFRDEVHSVRHALSQSVLGLTSWLDLLEMVRQENGGVVNDNDMLDDGDDFIRVSEIYNNLHLAVDDIRAKVNRFDRGYNFVAKNQAITEFIESYIDKHPSPRFDYLYDETIHHAPHTIREEEVNPKTGEVHETGKIILNEGDPIEYAKFSADALTIIFDNIISNAISHGFKGREKKYNTVKIELVLEGDDYVVSISNNGKPIEHGFAQKEVFAYGVSTENGNRNCENDNEVHRGLGGYEVKRLMNEFGDDAEFISTPDDKFTVTYKLIFHNTNIVTIEL